MFKKGDKILYFYSKDCNPSKGVIDAIVISSNKTHVHIRNMCGAMRWVATNQIVKREEK